MKNTLSIIIPVYNSAQYLRKCLDSILHQTFCEYEVWLIDDGSTDGSNIICDEYANKDERFNVAHIDNAGASNARNYGIDKSNGKWLAFIDSDDYLLSDYLEKLMGAAESDIGIVLSNYGGRQKDLIIRKSCRLEGMQMVDYFLDNKIFALSAPYGKLYNRNIVVENNIRFPIGINMGEDMIFMVNYMNKVNSASLVTDCSYIVNNTDGSLSTKYYSYKSEYKCLILWKKGIELFVSRGAYDDKKKEMLVWMNRTAGTFYRFCESMYKGPERLPILKSVNLMAQLPYDYYDNFGRCFYPKAISAKAKVGLLAKRQFLFYLLLGRLLNVIGK